MDILAAFETATQESITPARYTTRQLLDQEYQKYRLRLDADARQARYKSGNSLAPAIDLAKNDSADKPSEAEMKIKSIAVKRDFFGRIIDDIQSGSGPVAPAVKVNDRQDDRKVWVSFHEGFSNAVRKPVTLAELMQGF